jgi:hypothetical protein
MLPADPSGTCREVSVLQFATAKKGDGFIFFLVWLHGK